MAPLLVQCDGSTETVPEETRKSIGDQIDTFVVVMMENRSFDHYLGALSLEEGRTDIDGLSADMNNPMIDGSLVGPFHGTQYCQEDPPHGWSSSHAQYNEGANDGFVLEHEARRGPEEGKNAMAYFGSEDLPASYALAKEYTTCQNWHASVMGPTWPNRFYSLMGTSQGHKSNDPIEEELPTIFERVWRSGRTYKNYYGNIPFSSLCARLTLTDPEFQYLETFYEDAAAGTLPNLAWIDPIYGRNDDHPPTHPLAGQILIQSIYNALAQSPQWGRCLLLVTYDEHGGFFDHVPPPTVPDAFASDGFDLLGFRVPSLIAGPYVKQQYADSTVYDHTSIYRTIANLWDLEPLGLRDENANSFLSVIDEDALQSSNVPAPLSLAPIEADEEEIYHDDCIFSPTLQGGQPILGVTKQPELEAFAMARYKDHPKNRIGQTSALYKSFLDFTKTNGVWRPKR